MSAGDERGFNPIANSIPTRWQPGESGNPRGHSANRRQAKRLRRALDVVLEQELPPEWLEQLDDRVREVLPPDTTFAELVAVRLALIAGTSRDALEVLGAARVILGATQKPDQAAPPSKLGDPVLPGTEERRAAIAKQLGLADIES